MKKLGVLVKVGDEVAKIPPYVNLVWQVLPAGMKMVQAQQTRDQQILDLVTAMENTYLFVVSADKPVLQNIIEQILKQTIECRYFIHEYMRRNFGERVLVHPFTDVDNQIAKFCTAFTDLRKAFDSRLGFSVALVLSRTTATIDAMRRDQLLSTLKPVEMNEHDRKGCLPTTRLDVIESIIDWVTDESTERKSVLWLYGLAGSGKSTLSTTIAWMMRDLQRQGAFVIFDRDVPARNAATLIETLAYQLTMLDGHICHTISKIVEKIPRIAEMPLDFQIRRTISACTHIVVGTLEIY